jgi:hypothetical protein
LRYIVVGCGRGRGNDGRPRRCSRQHVRGIRSRRPLRRCRTLGAVMRGLLL